MINFREWFWSEMTLLSAELDLKRGPFIILKLS